MVITLVDGGYGDADGLENGIIVDPSGPGTPPSGGGNGDNDWCFIATAAYGTPMAEDIDYLRALRDEYLLKNPLGRKFVKSYYKTSPPVARFITHHPVLKPVVRFLLKPLVKFSKELTEQP